MFSLTMLEKISFSHSNNLSYVFGENVFIIYSSLYTVLSNNQNKMEELLYQNLKISFDFFSKSVCTI